MSRENGHTSVTSDSVVPIASVVYRPNWDADSKLPDPEIHAEAGRFCGYQYFPATAPTETQPNPPRSKDDSNFALHGVLAGQ